MQFVTAREDLDFQISRAERTTRFHTHKSVRKTKEYVVAFNVDPQNARQAALFIAVEAWLRLVAARSGNILGNAKIAVDKELYTDPPQGLGVADMVVRSHVRALNVRIHERLIAVGERPADDIVDYLELNACVTVRHVLARTIREAGV